MEYGKAKVVSGKNIVTDSVENRKYATIIPADKEVLLVNGEAIKGQAEIEVTDVGKNIDILISEDKMQVYLTLEYVSEKENEIVNCDFVEKLEVQVKSKEENIQKFTKEEIINALHEKGIKYGIKEDAIESILNEKRVENFLVAQGKNYIDAIDDEFIFANKVNEEIDKDSLKAIDYKNINKIRSVLANEIIGTIKPGADAQEGMNVLGKIIKSKKNKRKYIKSGNGCRIMSDNIIANINGQVAQKNGIVSVHNIYELQKNVDMSTGNINFKGDILISGDVNDGMKVTALNDIHISGSVFSSDVLAKGDVSIDGSIINSRVIVGGSDIVKENRLKLLVEFKEKMQSILEITKYVFDNRGDRKDISIAEVLRTIIETKHKDFRKLCLEIIGMAIKDNDIESLVVKKIKEKLMPTSIKVITSFEEIEEIIQLADEEINILQEEKMGSSTIKAGYCQESVLQSSGDIIIDGKGMFSTDLYALGTISFLNKSAVCRGGVLKAGKKIQATIVGTEAGTQTVLEVSDKKGTIDIDIAYANTLIIINNRKMLINKPSKQVKCYLDFKGELVIDKFIL